MGGKYYPIQRRGHQQRREWWRSYPRTSTGPKRRRMAEMPNILRYLRRLQVLVIRVLDRLVLAQGHKRDGDALELHTRRHQRPSRVIPRDRAGQVAKAYPHRFSFLEAMSARG